MSKFKVGDRIRGISNYYSITCAGWIGQVVNVSLDEERILTNDGYWVETKYFELLPEAQPESPPEPSGEDPDLRLNTLERRTKFLNKLIIRHRKANDETRDKVDAIGYNLSTVAQSQAESMDVADTMDVRLNTIAELQVQDAKFNDDTRSKVNELQNQVDGLIRQVLALSKEVIRLKGE